MKLILTIWAVVFLVVAVVGGGFWLYQNRIAPTAAATGSTTLTQIVEATEGSLSNTVSVVGELDAVQSEDLAFSHLSGLTKLATLKVTAGNTVHKGDVLATVDPASYQQALDQAKSDLQASQKKLADLEAPPTALALAQADLAIAQAQYDQQKAQSDLADQQAPNVSALKNTLQDAQDSVTQLGFSDSLAERDALAKSERDLSYTVDFYERRINELEAQKRKNLEENQELTDDQQKLIDLQAELAKVQAQRQLAKSASAAQKAKDQAVIDVAQTALAKGQAGGDKLALANAQLAVQTATVALAKAQDDKTTLVAGANEVDLATAQADVDKKQLTVSDAETALAGTQLVASFDGTVLKTNANVGDQVDANTVVLTVADLKGLQVVASVDETTIRRVSEGQSAKISFDAFPGQTFTGKVLSVPLQGTLQNDVMVYEVPISLEGAEKLPLLVGMTANVEVETESAANALLVPSIALQRVNGQYEVLVPNPNDPKGAPVMVAVEVGLSDGTYTQITQGLKAGDEVIVQLPSVSGTNNGFPRGGFGGPGFGAGPVFIQSGPGGGTRNGNNGR